MLGRSGLGKRCGMSLPTNEEVFTTWTTDMDDLDLSVVYLCGELDASSTSAFLKQTQDVVSRRRDVIMDVHLLEYTDSTGIAAILSVRNALHKAGKRLYLAGCHGLLQKILYTIRADKELICFEDVDRAVQAIRDQ